MAQPTASQQVIFVERPAALTVLDRIGMNEMASWAFELICICE
jgi:hypothetical protein